MFCINCGSEVKSGKFCPNCGAQVGSEEEKVASEVIVENNVNEIKAEPEVVTGSTSTTPIVVDIAEETNSSNSNSTSSNGVEYSQKSKIAAGLLGIFLGAFGVHNFYLGYTGKAVAQLLISILSCGFLAAASSIWGLVEGIMILATNDYKDAQGRILKD